MQCNEIKIYGYVNITNLGVYPRHVEGNAYISGMFDNCIVWSKLWLNEQGICRKNGPAMYTKDMSSQIWCTELYMGKHRLDGPQAIYPEGVEYWAYDKYIGDNEQDFKRWHRLNVIS